ncbi:hypothetical protein AB1Y20_006584 [Prymnesium parvum]|uniref:CAP-Gly domain-containing protein n=1 Tax=Prymnesium parvum TaxID=97485 RepID=A0AB34J118_PRYPA
MARLDNDSANVIGLLLGTRPSESNGASAILSDLKAAAAETSRPPEWELTPSPPLCTEEHSSPVEGIPKEDSLKEDEDHLQALVKRAAAATAAARHAKMLADEAFAELESACRERDQIESALREGARGESQTHIQSDLSEGVLEVQTQFDTAQSPILTDHGNLQEASHSPQRPCTSDGDDDEPRIVELCEPRLHGCPPVTDEEQESKSPWETAAAPCASSSWSEMPSISPAPASSTPFAFWIGCGVRVEGLRQRSDLNGCLGQIVDYSAGRYGVRILGRSDRRGNPLGVRLLPMNMVPGVLPEDAVSPSGPPSSATTDGRKEIRTRAQNLDMGEADKPVQTEPSTKQSKSPHTHSKHAGELTEDKLRHAAELEASRRRSAAEGAKAAEAIALQYAKAVSEEVKTRNMELAAVEPELPLDRPQRKKAEPCNINKPMQEMRYRPPQDTPREATTKDATHAASHPKGLTGKDAVDAEMGTLFGEGQSGMSGFVPVRSTEGFVVGDRVFVHGLEYHRELNGTAGTITGLSGGRFEVRLMGRRERSGAHVILWLPPENIRGRSQDGLSLDALPHPRNPAHVTSEASSKATGNDAQLIADSSGSIETDELGHVKHEKLVVDDDQAAEAIEKSGQVRKYQ